jgi:hypothetical protein
VRTLCTEWLACGGAGGAVAAGLAALLLALVLAAPAAIPAVGAPDELTFQLRLETPLEHDDGRWLWYHPRVAPLPPPRRGAVPGVVMLLQRHLIASDHYSGLSAMRTDDLGATWSPPTLRPELDWRPGGPGVDVGPADMTPGWLRRSRRVLAVGALVRYNRAGEQLDDTLRAHQTAYTLFDPDAGGEAWTPLRLLEMPGDERFHYARSACAQWVERTDGSLLLPFYHGANSTDPFRVSVVEAALEGDTLRYRRAGNELALPGTPAEVVRGLVEPSLARFRGRYYLTLRNDRRGYVTTSRDGLRWPAPRPWTFDDGSELGSYNTQQHWLVHSEGLYLVYTRHGAGNDHIIRHRAPLFAARVDPERLVVLRATERVLIPERGGELGNFGVTAISREESWVTVGEGVWSDDARRRGARGSVFVARVLWSRPNREVPW